MKFADEIHMSPGIAQAGKFVVSRIHPAAGWPALRRAESRVLPQKITHSSSVASRKLLPSGSVGNVRGSKSLLLT